VKGIVTCAVSFLSPNYPEISQILKSTKAAKWNPASASLAILSELLLRAGSWYIKTETAPDQRPYNRSMKPRNLFASAIVAFLLLSAPKASAADVKTYQVTGPVLEVTPTSITVQKGDEKWQIARDKSTKVTGDLKVGAKVTIQYRMVGVDVEVKK